MNEQESDESFTRFQQKKTIKVSQSFKKLQFGSFDNQNLEEEQDFEQLKRLYDQRKEDAEKINMSKQQSFQDIESTNKNQMQNFLASNESIFINGQIELDKKNIQKLQKKQSELLYQKQESIKEEQQLKSKQLKSSILINKNRLRKQLKKQGSIQSNQDNDIWSYESLDLDQELGKAPEQRKQSQLKQSQLRQSQLRQSQFRNVSQFNSMNTLTEIDNNILKNTKSIVNKEIYKNDKQLLNKIIEYLFQKYPKIDQKNFCNTYLERFLDIKFTQFLENKIKEFTNGFLNFYQFLQIMFAFIKTKNEDLIIFFSTYKLFHNIIEYYHLTENQITFLNVSDYITQNYYKVNKTDTKLQIKQFCLPQQSLEIEKQSQIREIDINAPSYINKKDFQMNFINKNVRNFDKITHEKFQINNGFYLSDSKQFLILRNQTGYIMVINQKLKIQKYIQPKFDQQQLKQDQIILNFVYSYSQKRVGACMNDYHLIFWDIDDNFTYEKRISTIKFLNEIQNKIYFIEFYNVWLTSDIHNNINFWDICLEQLQYKFTQLKSQIVRIVELPQLKLIAIACTNKFIYFLNLNSKQITMKIDLVSENLDILVFFETYQVLLSSGFSKDIIIYQIDYQNNEYNYVDKIIGNNGLITDIKCIENTPIIITIDDKYLIKIWDIRDLKCAQHIQDKTNLNITKIIVMPDTQNIAFLGQRLMVMEWINKLNSNIVDKNSYPINIEYLEMENYFRVCSQNFVKTYDIQNGKAMNIFNGYLDDADYKIKYYLSIDRQNFILGDDQGNLYKQYFKDNLKKEKELISHTNEIILIKYDHINNMILSVGYDSLINLQRETNNGYKLIKQITNIFNGDPLTILEISFAQNMMAIGNHDQTVYIYEYESFKLLYQIRLPKKNEYPTSFKFSDHYKVFMIFSSESKIYFFKTSFTIQTYNFECIVSTDTRQTNYIHNFEHNDSFNFDNILIDCQYNEEELLIFDIYATMLNGKIFIYNFKTFVKLYQIERLIQNQYDKNSYDPYKIQKENFQQQIEKSDKIIQIKNEAVNHGLILKKIIYAHKKKINTISLINIDQQLIVTTSDDKYFCIHNLDGSLQAKVNINHPLPLKWDLNIDFQLQLRKTIDQLIQELAQIKEKDMFISEVKFNIYRMKKQIIAFNKKDDGFFTEVNIDAKNINLKKNQNEVMADYYNKKEITLQSNVIKLFEINKRPNLHDLDKYKYFYQKQQNKQQDDKESQSNKKIRIKEDSEIDFYFPEYRQNLNNQESDDFQIAPEQEEKKSQYIIDLEYKLNLKNKIQQNQLHVQAKQIKQIKQDKLISQSLDFSRNYLSKHKVTPNLSQINNSLSSINKSRNFLDHLDDKSLIISSKLEKSRQSIQNSEFQNKSKIFKLIDQLNLKVKQSKLRSHNKPMTYLPIEQDDIDFLIQKKRTDNFSNNYKKAKDLKQLQEEKVMQDINESIDEFKSEIKENALQKIKMQKVIKRIDEKKDFGIDDIKWLISKKQEIEKKNKQIIDMSIENLSKKNYLQKKITNKNYSQKQFDDSDYHDILNLDQSIKSIKSYLKLN